jgi:hypothetical protein
LEQPFKSVGAFNKSTAVRRRGNLVNLDVNNIHEIIVIGY